MDLEAIERSCKYLNQLFLHTINNMKSGFIIWKDFTCKAAKLHVSLKSICQVVSGFLEAFQKVADLATNAKGATKEIGVALTRLCLRHRNIEKKLDHVTQTFGSTLINPVEEKLEEWKKIVFQIEKDHARDSKKALREFKKITLQVEKLEKKNKKVDTNTHKELTVLSFEKREKLVAMEAIEKTSVRSALLEERKRHCHMIQAIRPFVEAEMALLSDLVHLEEIMSSLTRQSQEPNVLPGSSEQVILDITSQTIPEGWSCQPTKNLPSQSESLLSLSSAYSFSNRSSIVSDYDSHSSIIDLPLNASLSSLPASLQRNHRGGGSVPPPLDRGHRNGRPLFRQSLYNPAMSTSGITYLQQQQHMQHLRQQQMEENSRFLFPSTSAPSTPEAKVQMEQSQSVLTKLGSSLSQQQKITGKPPTFPPSYLRRKGSFGKALYPSQSNSSSVNPSPTSSFQSIQWSDVSERPRSMAIGGLAPNQLSHSYSERMVCTLAPPVTHATSFSSSSTLKDEDEKGENMKSLVPVSDGEGTLKISRDNLPPKDETFTSLESSVKQEPIIVHVVPPTSSSPMRQTHPQTSVTQSPRAQSQHNSSIGATRSAPRAPQAHNTQTQYNQISNGISAHKVMSPRNGQQSFASVQRSPSAMSPQQIMNSYKIHSDMSGRSPTNAGHVDFQGQPRSVAGYNQSYQGMPTMATNQMFINLECSTPQQRSYAPTLHSVQTQMMHSVPKSQPHVIRVEAKESIAQLEDEPHAYGKVSNRQPSLATYEQHFQEKLIPCPSHHHPQLAHNSNAMARCSVHQSPSHIQFMASQHSCSGHLSGQSRCSASPSTKRQILPPPAPPLPSNLDDVVERGLEGQFCPWTLRSPEEGSRSNSATPTNEIDPENEDEMNDVGVPQPGMPPNTPLRYPPIPLFDKGADGGENHRQETEQSLPKGFVKHWENTV